MGDSAFFEAPGLQQQMGIGSGKQRLVGVSDVSVTAVSTVGAGEQTLKSSTLKANSLSEDGKAAKIKAWGTAVGTAGTRTMSLKFGGSVVAQVVIPAAVVATSWFLEAVVVRGGAGFVESGSVGVASANIANAVTAIPPVGNTTDVPIIVTGNPANAADIITARGLAVEFLN